jgi:hypothetical protein
MTLTRTAAFLIASSMFGCGIEPEALPDSPSLVGKPAGEPADLRMSAMGQRAREHAAQLFWGLPDCHGDPDCREVFAGGGQAETSIAVDETGQHIVVGFNDTRGFSKVPVSVSGFFYSEDGGATFVDGGQLPSPDNEVVGATRLPQIFGDPEVEYLGNCTFIYTSIILKRFSATATVQTLGMHRSVDCGKTWVGPFEVTAASNPSGTLTTTGAPTDVADKEFTAVDPETGRVIVTWSNFTPNALGGVQISATYTDDILADQPTFSPATVIAATARDGQASIPMFSPSSDDVYVAWRRSGGPSLGATGFSRSEDNGATWSEPIDVAPAFFVNDQVLGNDRINSSPSLAVDDDHVYVVYAANDNRDGSDIVFVSSADRGTTFTAPSFLNSRPGADRSQWFPWITVDADRGRVYTFYYDQGIDRSGDLTEVQYQYSDNAGGAWSQPRPLSRRPFHAAYGNDTGQPNLGDYNQAIAQRGELFAVFAETTPVGFTDGQPTSGSFTTPDTTVKRLRFLDQLPSVGVALGEVRAIDASGGTSIDPGERIRVTVPVRNYVTNPINARSIHAVLAVASTTTPGVTVEQPLGVYGSLTPGQTRDNLFAYRLRLAPEFVAGTPIELSLRVLGSTGLPRTLLATVQTTAPVAQTVFAESFDGVAPGALPVGWTVAHGGGANTVPWRTATGFCGDSNGAFHPNAEDGPALGQATRFERLFSPTFTVPANAAYLEVDLDVCYDTEDDAAFNILAFDGFLVRVTDVTPGNILRSVLVDAFATQFTTGASKGYPKHFPRSSNRNYFEDMSAWAGDSQGVQHVRLRLPGMAGTTAQLRFEFTQDAISTCTDVRPDHPNCGVFVDNIVVRSVGPAATPIAAP